jgi:hypothetical protein
MGAGGGAAGGRAARGAVKEEGPEALRAGDARGEPTVEAER